MGHRGALAQHLFEGEVRGLAPDRGLEDGAKLLAEAIEGEAADLDALVLDRDLVREKGGALHRRGDEEGAVEPGHDPGRGTPAGGAKASAALGQLGPEELLRLADLAADLALANHVARRGLREKTAEPVEGEAAFGEEGANMTRASSIGNLPEFRKGSMGCHPSWGGFSFFAQHIRQSTENRRRAGRECANQESGAAHATLFCLVVRGPSSLVGKLVERGTRRKASRRDISLPAAPPVPCPASTSSLPKRRTKTRNWRRIWSAKVTLTRRCGKPSCRCASDDSARHVSFCLGQTRGARPPRSTSPPTWSLSCARGPTTSSKPPAS